MGTTGSLHALVLLPSNLSHLFYSTVTGIRLCVSGWPGSSHSTWLTSLLISRDGGGKAEIVTAIGSDMNFHTARSLLLVGRSLTQMKEWLISARLIRELLYTLIVFCLELFCECFVQKYFILCIFCELLLWLSLYVLAISSLLLALC